MADEWNKVAKEWDAKPGVADYCNAFFEALLDFVPDLSGMKVLDYGCGTGLLTSKLLAAGASHVVCVDVAEEMINVVKSKEFGDRVTAVCADLTAKGGAQKVDDDFDLVVASSSIAFTDDYAQTVKILASRLKKGGILMSTDWESEHVTPTTLRAAYEGAGLAPLKIGDAFSVDAGGMRMEPLMAIGTK